MTAEDWHPASARWWENRFGSTAYPGYTVSGGLGGAAFQWEELEDAAARLEAIADRVEQIRGEAAEVERELLEGRLAPVPGWFAVRMAVLGAWSAMAQGARQIRELSDSVRQALRVYAAAEQAVRSGLDAVDRSTSWLTVPLGALGNEGRPTRDGAGRVLNNAPEALAVLLGLPPAFAAMVLRDARHGRVGSLPVPGRLAPVLVAAANSAGLLRTAPITVAQAGPAGAVSVAPTPAGLLARAAAAEQAGPGHIEVVEVRKDGRNSWVVALPGTQGSGGPAATANPFDETGIAEALAADSRFVAEAVSRALAEAGAAPGEPVILAGYSQGGIHAMNLARNREFLSRHHVQYVLTAGSPVGDRRAAPGVKSLHLEHRQDWVAGADGVPNPDGRDQVTVTLTGRVETPAGGAAGLGPGHNFGNYMSAARALELSPDPSVADTASIIAGTLAGATARRQVFRLTRQPAVPDRTAAPPGPPRAAEAARRSGGAGARSG
ncbi:hypothetical protein ACFQ36_09100 [Arthrobacter sp. GCM10027362]|uniref:hypothetical protein n=1 Tax=Arthrobacter sp. GCM10027362 TaxID=3273379 RepID=UPI0036424A76